jgi:biopolymer transport protein ExbB
LLSIIQAAGWPIWPLILCSVLALALIVDRFMNLRAERVVPAKLVDEVINVSRGSLPRGDVLDKLAGSSVLGEVLAAGLRTAVAEGGRPNEVLLRDAFETAGRAAVHQLERNLNALGTIATAAPLLGLLGTVVGMIEIFGAQGPGNGGPEALAHGISIALYNTAFGLIVAIPALAFHRHFRARVDAFALGIEQGAERLMHHLLRAR